MSTQVLNNNLLNERIQTAINLIELYFHYKSSVVVTFIFKTKYILSVRGKEKIKRNTLHLTVNYFLLKKVLTFSTFSKII